jgi:hypothetical protein
MQTISNNNSSLLENVTPAHLHQQYVKPAKNQTFPPLDQVTSPTVTTEAAAYYLNRKPQTMRIWACMENGPVRPSRINGRLAWPVFRLKELTGVV